MSEPLAYADIVRRFTDFFERQIAYFEQMREEIEQIAGGADSESLDDALAQDTARARTGRELEEEFRALKNEWDGTESIPDESVDEIRALGVNAARLATELQAALEDAARTHGDQSETLRERLGELRQGREQLMKYRPTRPTGGGLIDHQA